jgi:membrane-bound lytic murein transglycosylase D
MLLRYSARASGCTKGHRGVGELTSCLIPLSSDPAPVKNPALITGNCLLTAHQRFMSETDKTSDSPGLSHSTGMQQHLSVAFRVIVCCLCLAAASIFGSPAVGLSAVTHTPDPIDTTAEKVPYPIEYNNIPLPMFEIMRSSWSKYLEGTEQIKMGDSDNARAAFNEAVDLLLTSEWDLASEMALNHFFQDLIRRIQQDERRYILESGEAENVSEDDVVDEANDLNLIPIKVDPALQASFAMDLAHTKYEIPITVNEMVLKSLNHYLNSGRRYFVDGLLRSGQYRSIIERVFREESLPLDLMYLAQVESMFKTHAVSTAQAKGIWQFGKSTAIHYGLRVNRDVDERADPEKSTRAAARYLKDLFAKFNDWNLVLAAYNWGEGKVERLVKSTGLKDFWQLVNLKRKLPEETKRHIPRIQASVILAHNPEKYGLPTELDPPLQYSEVQISKRIDLRKAAQVLGISFNELKRLNPALRGTTTPANYPDFRLKVPANCSPEIYKRLASLSPAKTKPSKKFAGRHKVQPGETLIKIAARYKTTVAELEEENNLYSEDILYAGTWLQVPAQPSTQKN